MQEMKSLDNLEIVFLEKIWTNYVSLENKKENSLSLLFLTLLAFILLWLIPSQDFKFPILGNELPRSIALSLSPFFVLFLTSKYLYLSALSLNVFMNYIRYFRKVYNASFDENRILISSLYNNFKIRNLSGTLNLFLLPRRVNQTFNKRFERIIHRITILLNIILTLSTFLVPLAFSLGTAIWFYMNRHIVNENVAIFILLVYGFSILTLLLFAYSLFNSTKIERTFYKKEIINRT